MEFRQFRHWLDTHFGPRQLDEQSDLQLLVRECHRARKVLLFDPLSILSGQDQSRYPKFERLFKLLCKLGKHVTVCRKIFDAVVLLPQDFSLGFVPTVEIVSPSELRNLPLMPKEATVESTANRMFSASKEDEKEKFVARVKATSSSEELSRLLYNQIKSKTRVHAELLLVDRFEQTKANFLGSGEKYIGCSKPACYLCFAYIRHHPAQYATPSSHQKLYIGWRMPDIFSDEPHSGKRSINQEQTLLKMIEEVRKDLQTEIDSRQPRIPYHADSTAGITSSGIVTIVDTTDGSEPIIELPDVSTSEQDQLVFDYFDSDEDGGVPLF
jgi:hypothetical protein